MAKSVDDLRRDALAVAKWLVGKERAGEAVELLSAWAAAGPNDALGQELLADALRIDPSARVAQLAFESMEGVSKDPGELRATQQRFDEAALHALKAEMSRASFRRAQMGFNNNIKFQDKVFHVQTEDSGLDSPHIITHLFADGGRVIKSHKRSYAEHVQRADAGEFVRGLMKAQHLEMVLALREGKFERILRGEEVGGLELLTEAPNVDLKKLAQRKEERAQAAPPPDAETTARAVPAPQRAPTPMAAAPAAPDAKPRFVVYTVSGPSDRLRRFAPVEAKVVLGSRGSIVLPDERFCHPKEAQFLSQPDGLWLEDLEGGNGVFLRVRGVVELEFSDEFVIGKQLLRVERNPIPDDGPDPAPTYFYSSPKWPSSFRVVQVLEGGAAGGCVVSRGNTLQIGSAVGDMLFTEDSGISPQHCLVEEHAGAVVLTDLDSETGVFVRINGKQQLVHGDELVVGRTHLRIDLIATS